MSTDIQQAAIALTQAAEAYRQAAMNRLASASIDELHTMAAASAAEAVTSGAVRVRAPAKKVAKKVAAADTEETPHKNPVRPPKGEAARRTDILSALMAGELSSEQIQEATGIDKATMKKVLSKMRQENAIGMRGEKRGARYYIRK
jgi:hypothetical protein